MTHATIEEVITAFQLQALASANNIEINGIGKDIYTAFCQQCQGPTLADWFADP